ncbi:MAG: hypothetical protein Fur0018_13110 [Anaerolineales bacterium]
MKKGNFWNRLKLFFFPPEDTSLWLKLLPYAVLGVLTLLVFTGGSYAWEYTNTSQFCGTACHTMPPEYTTYQGSPHANVKCTSCHLAQAPFLSQLWHKAGEIRHVIDINLGRYEYPIFATNMPSTHETCETCHAPEKISAASLEQMTRYGDDLENTPTSIYLLMKTGGGNVDGGVGPFIHWHATGKVQFLTDDPQQQHVSYVRVTLPDGSMKEFYDLSAGLTPNDIAGTYLYPVTCTTCHNRISHLIHTPAESVDIAMQEGRIATDLPEIHRKAVELLSLNYTTQQAGLNAIAKLEDYYRQKYPSLWGARANDIRQAVTAIQEIFVGTNFPEQALNAQTHPNNLGHKDFPGCFRCHDGQHLTQTGEAIPYACDTCHAIPAVVDGEPTSVTLSLNVDPRPPSHSNSLWPALHGQAMDQSCAVCHPPTNPETDYTKLNGKPPADGSFCGNTACHQSVWKYAGWDAPELKPVLARALYILQNTSPYLLDGAPRTYEGAFKAIFDGRCIGCHSGPDAKAGLDLSTYADIRKGGKNGPGIVPGDPAASLIFQRQTRRNPHFGQMMKDELKALEAWILAGAPQQ